MNSPQVIPQEICDFFSKEGGRSLLVKGSPGTGKTTFALQLLEALTKTEHGLYLSTRVSDESLYRQFPWLEEKEMRGRIVDSSRVLLEALAPPEDEAKHDYDPEAQRRVSSAKDFLRSIDEKVLTPPSKVDRTRLRVLLERIRMPEVERVYDRIQTILPSKPTLVVDSVEGITQKYGLDMDEFIFCLQKDLVEQSNTNILFVTEKGEPDGIEFLVDGVVRLTHETVSDKRVRHMQLMKLRATEIRQPSYLVSLKNGRFRSFNQFDPNYKVGKWAPLPDTYTHYSTGVPDIDALLGGGYQKGSYNVIEIDHNVPTEEYQLVLRPILLNFLLHDRGVVAVLNGGAHSQAMRDDLVRFMPPEKFDSLVRVADYFISQSNLPYVMALGKRDEALRIWKANQELLRGKDNKPLMDYTGFDTLEYLQGGEVAIKGLLEAVSRIKFSMDVGVGVLKPGLRSAQEIVNMADTYFHVTDIDRRPCIYGLKPKTILYALVADEEKGLPYVKLEPIV